MIDMSKPMTPEWLGLIEALSQAVGPPGSEGPVRALVRRELAGRVDSLETDRMGNLLAVKHARGQAKLRVMLAAHMDEVGFMVKTVDSDGFLQVAILGSIQAEQVLGKRVWIGAEFALGVVGLTPIHLATPSEREARPSLDAMRVDLGLSAQAVAEMGIRPGSTGTLAGRFEADADNLWGKAFDDRLGVALLMSLLDETFESVEMLGAFTVQEELGARGAAAAAFGLSPDVGIAIDCTPARDLPTASGGAHSDFNTRLGQGPAIYVADGRMISDPRLTALALQSAESQGNPRIKSASPDRAARMPPPSSALETACLHLPSRFPLDTPTRQRPWPRRRTSWPPALCLQDSCAASRGVSPHPRSQLKPC